MTDPFSTEFYFDSFFEPDSPPRLHTSSVLAFEGNQDERPPLLSQTSFNERGNIDYSFIDLTHDTISPAMEERNRGPRPRSLYKSDPSSDEDDTPTPVAKRRRIGNRETRLMAPEKVETKIEEADLRDVDDDHGLSKVLEQQRASTIKAQRGESNKSLLITNQQCVVCMEDMTNITATHCGHLFCHTCLNEALIVGEQQGPDPGKSLSRCPICRKKVVRAKDGKDSRSVIPLEIKLGPKKTTRKGKEKASIPARSV